MCDSQCSLKTDDTEVFKSRRWRETQEEVPPDEVCMLQIVNSLDLVILVDCIDLNMTVPLKCNSSDFDEISVTVTHESF